MCPVLKVHDMIVFSWPSGFTHTALCVQVAVVCWRGFTSSKAYSSLIPGTQGPAKVCVHLSFQWTLQRKRKILVVY